VGRVNRESSTVPQSIPVDPILVIMRSLVAVFQPCGEMNLSKFE
jgi:hypothetical protein